jgi:DNA repair protein RadD
MTQELVGEWLPVTHIEYNNHHGKTGTDSFRVEYYTGIISSYCEWICFNHTGFPRDKALRWWKFWDNECHRSGINHYPPNDVDEAVKRSSELSKPTHIQVEMDGKFWRIKKYGIELEDGTWYEIDSSSLKATTRRAIPSL